MNTRIFNTLITLLLAAVAHADRPPNVVFVMADDLGYGDLGCYGATHFETPACDRLAREGMRFSDAHSPSAVCTPTRYSVLTGRYAWRSWLKNWVLLEQHPLLIQSDRLTMGELFQNAGYTTGCVGKWHLGWGTELNPDLSAEPKPGPLECGYDSFFGVPFSHNSAKAWQVFVRGREVVHLQDGLSHTSREAMNETVRALEETAIELSHEAVAYIEKNREQPFFLYYPTTNVHFPLTPNERFKGKTRAGVYGDFTIEFDWAVGQIIDTLDRLGLTDQTIVVVTSDNGARPAVGMNGHACNGPLREATVHHSVSGQFAIRKGDWKLIEGSGNGDYPRDAEGRIAVVTRTPQRDPNTGR